MNYKELLGKIEDMLNLGATKEQIFSEIGRNDDNARILAAIPTIEKRAKYSSLNRVLSIIIFYFAAVKFLSSCYNFISLGLPIYAFLVTLFVPVCAIAFGIGIVKFRGYFYLPMGWLGVLTLIKGTNVHANSSDLTFWTVWLAIYIPVACGTILAFFLKKKLCPYLGFIGAKTDDSGHYLFLQEQANQSPESGA